MPFEGQLGLGFFFHYHFEGGRLTTGVSWYHLGVSRKGSHYFSLSTTSTLGPRTPPPLSPPNWLTIPTNTCGLLPLSRWQAYVHARVVTTPIRETCCILTLLRCSSVAFSSRRLFTRVLLYISLGHGQGVVYFFFFHFVRSCDSPIPPEPGGRLS